MTELWGGHYIYTFVWYNPAVDYVYDCNPGATSYIEIGVTNNIEQLISEIRTGGGGWFINYQAINSHTTSKVNELKKEFEKIPKTDLSEIKSHIDVAKDDILNKIDDIEIPEADVSEITNGIGVLKQRFTKLSEFLRKESDMEKEWMKKELESKIEEIEQAYEDMKLLHSEEIESKTSEV